MFGVGGLVNSENHQWFANIQISSYLLADLFFFAKIFIYPLSSKLSLLKFPTTQYKVVVTHSFALYLHCKHSTLKLLIYKSDTNLVDVL